MTQHFGRSTHRHEILHDRCRLGGGNDEIYIGNGLAKAAKAAGKLHGLNLLELLQLGHQRLGQGQGHTYWSSILFAANSLDGFCEFFFALDAHAFELANALGCNCGSQVVEVAYAELVTKSQQRLGPEPWNAR